jgi:multidrug efflux system membrane fusion protein
VAVNLATATRRDVPVWLTGIGSVQAYNTVTLRPRVSGTLDTVNFTEGQMVREGDVLAQIDPRPYRAVVEQVRAKKEQDEAQLASARLELARVRTLVESAVEGRRLLEQQEATVARLIALVQADEAAIQAAQLDLDFTTVRAPVSGRTGFRLVDAGNVVTANQGAGLVVITQMQPISVIFTLPQTHLRALRARSRPEDALTVEAYGDDGAKLAKGRLDLVDNQIDAATGTLRLKASFANDDLALWPGQFVTARVLVETLRDAVVVPARAVQAGLDGPFVYLLRPDNTVEPRSVQTGLTVEGMTVVEGLAAGDRVVLDGHNKLKPGALVAIAEVRP